jgi:sec-independent protein translocase protein TatB
MHFADYTLILVLALILFGPKKLPEIARQIGKLMVEFRRASNEFKSQIEDELRTMEQQDRQKKLEAAAAPALAASHTAAYEIDASEEASRPVILPPTIGEIVSATGPRIPVASQELLDAAALEPHPIYAEALVSETRESETMESETLESEALGLKNGTGRTAARPGDNLGSEPESKQATLNHG